jgi:hypothetical protein
MGGGRAGLGGKRGGPVTHSQNFYKNFSLLSHSENANQTCVLLLWKKNPVNGEKCQISRVYTKDWPTEK